MATPNAGFRFKDETVKRCQIIELAPTDEGQFVKVSLELFGYLYQASRIDFSIFFRAGNTVAEFIKPSEFSKHLLDEIWGALQRHIDALTVCVRRRDKARFDHTIDTVRRLKVQTLMKTTAPTLDQKTLDIYCNLSSASQMIVAGGIDQDVATSVRATASYLVANQLDSDTALDTLSRMISCDPTLYDHSATVAMLGAVIGQKAVKKPLSPAEIQVVAQCALYHDVGKTCVPSSILNKPGKFTPEEFEVMKTHSPLGQKELEDAIAHGLPIDQHAAMVAGEHHEKFHGGGYPRNKKGRREDDAANGIHLFTRIVTIADIYSALLMKRVYKEAFEPLEALKIMVGVAQDLDPEIFPAFLQTVVASLNAKATRGSGRILTIDEHGQLAEMKKGA